jgi:hypothetical protein
MSSTSARVTLGLVKSSSTEFAVNYINQNAQIQEIHVDLRHETYVITSTVVRGGSKRKKQEFKVNPNELDIVTTQFGEGDFMYGRRWVVNSNTPPQGQTEIKNVMKEHFNHKMAEALPLVLNCHLLDPLIDIVINYCKYEMENYRVIELNPLNMYGGSGLQVWCKNGGESIREIMRERRYTWTETTDVDIVLITDLKPACSLLAPFDCKKERESWGIVCYHEITRAKFDKELDKLVMEFGLPEKIVCAEMVAPAVEWAKARQLPWYTIWFPAVATSAAYDKHNRDVVQNCTRVIVFNSIDAQSAMRKAQGRGKPTHLIE